MQSDFQNCRLGGSPCSGFSGFLGELLRPVLAWYSASRFHHSAYFSMAAFWRASSRASAFVMQARAFARQSSADIEFTVSHSEKGKASLCRQSVDTARVPSTPWTPSATLDAPNVFLGGIVLLCRHRLGEVPRSSRSSATLFKYCDQLHGQPAGALPLKQAAAWLQPIRDKCRALARLPLPIGCRIASRPERRPRRASHS